MIQATCFLGTGSATDTVHTNRSEGVNEEVSSSWFLRLVDHGVLLALSGFESKSVSYKRLSFVISDYPVLGADGLF